MNQTMMTETAPAMSAGEELEESIRRAERLLAHYRATGRRSEVTMLEREISQARVRLAIGNDPWMRKSLEALATYED